jgi:hypothetical protein
MAFEQVITHKDSTLAEAPGHFLTLGAIVSQE